MTPANRQAIRHGVNLATLPDEVVQELSQEREDCLQRDTAVKANARRLLGLRKNRIQVERELGLLGDLGPAVRAQLNKLISEGKA
ncbi:hypothetical protein EF096_01835 [Pseudomonas neustonica]|uniref:DUF615 domain-containing protein n=1 Tax=Pseudomonas neustonica TaxID=2487346 RepID=A0ABX9XN59_9PSED|nr:MULTISPECIES: hypothetical protein [Pseudomonas]ROZ86928.1 hypothetical protein EF099_00865 [Pseudomonas sp. SSM44]ROZ88456.1 hypothetical protein EF096_01835 [Pseudomonas neustonica]